MKKQLILLEVGVLVDDMRKYRNVYDNVHGYYAEDRTYLEMADLKFARAQAMACLEQGVEGTYAIITDQGMRNVSDGESVSDICLDGSETYALEDVIWNAVKRNGMIEKNFLHVPIKEKKEKLFEIAYRKYQLRWMMDHGYDLKQFLTKIQDRIDDGADSIKEAFGWFLSDSGFDGSIWACREEFRETEWNDEGYMESLLTAKEFFVWEYCRR